MQKYVEKKLDKVRKFRLGMLAQKRIEGIFKKPFAKIDHENLTIDEFSSLLWATLEQTDRDELSTPEKLLEVLDECLSMKEVYGLFQEIAEEAFGKNEPTPMVADEPEENGTGIELYRTL